MHNIGKNIEKYFLNTFDQKIKVNSVKEATGGFLSNAYVVDYTIGGENKKMFLRSIKSRDGGYSYNAERLKAFSISHEMYTNSDLEIESYGVMSTKNSEIIFSNEIGKDTEFYHIQSFVAGELYSGMIRSIESKTELDKNDIDVIRKIANKIGHLHKKKVKDIANENSIYIRSIHEVLINPEITFDILNSFPKEHKFFGETEFKYDYVKTMYKIIDSYKNRNRKLCYLHGDFWDANILIDKNLEPYFIDFSRIPYGEAGIDIGWFVGNLVVMKTMTGNKLYIDLAKEFIDEYINVTGDKDILKFCLLSFLWLGIINMFPPVYSDKDPIIGERMLEKILSDVRKGELILE